MWRVLFVLLALGACSSKAPAPEEPVEALADADEGEPTDGDAEVDGASEGAVPARKTPSELYAECRDRVEGPSSEGECTTDADCAPAGCSKEVCIPAAMGQDIMTTCEKQPCFTVLDSCGCVEGVCSWALKAETPPFDGPVMKLPNKLPGAPEAPAKGEAPADGEVPSGAAPAVDGDAVDDGPEADGTK